MRHVVVFLFVFFDIENRILIVSFFNYYYTVSSTKLSLCCRSILLLPALLLSFISTHETPNFAIDLPCGMYLSFIATQ